MCPFHVTKSRLALLACPGWANGMEGSDDVWYEDVVIHDKLMERTLHGLTTDNQSGRIASTRNSEVVHGCWIPCGRRAAVTGGTSIPVVAKVSKGLPVRTPLAAEPTGFVRDTPSLTPLELGASAKALAQRPPVSYLAKTDRIGGICGSHAQASPQILAPHPDTAAYYVC